MLDTSNRKRVAVAALTLLAIAGLGYNFFQAARASWSWPVAILLALCWGAVCLWVVRRVCRGADEAARQEEHDDQEKHV